jgi:hypothetical protein
MIYLGRVSQCLSTRVDQVMLDKKQYIRPFLCDVECSLHDPVYYSLPSPPEK